MHREAADFIARALATLPARTSVVEIGARDINGSIRPLFGDATYLAVDITDGRGVDVVADGATWQPDAPVDTVVCCEVLEHAANADAIIANAARMLEPGGVLLLTAASDPRRPHSAVDGAQLRADEYYGNIDAGDLHDWLYASFATFDITTNGRGDIYALATTANTPDPTDDAV